MDFSPSPPSLLLLLLLLPCPSTCWLASAQPAGQAYLAGHNAARAAVGVPPLAWDAGVAAFSENYANAERVANACRLLEPSGGPYGENKFWGSPGKQWTAEEAVSSWVELKQYYNASTNTCSRGGEQRCGVYTQVVWRSTTALGCAASICADNSSFVICNYNPPGNVIGQRPF